jgi:hypothetical protein
MKQNYDSDKTFRYVHDLSLFQISFVLGQHSMKFLHKKIIFNCLQCLFFLFYTKMISLKIVCPLKICLQTKFNGPKLTGESFASTSEV